MHLIINRSHKEAPMWAHKGGDILRNLSIFYVEKGIRSRSRGASAWKRYILLSRSFALAEKFVDSLWSRNVFIIQRDCAHFSLLSRSLFDLHQIFISALRSMRIIELFSFLLIPAKQYIIFGCCCSCCFEKSCCHHGHQPRHFPRTAEHNSKQYKTTVSRIRAEITLNFNIRTFFG